VLHTGLVGLAAGGIVLLLSFKLGRLTPRPALLAGLMVAFSAGLVAELALILADLLRRRHGAVRSAGASSLVVGLLLVVGGGTANWLFALQGFVIINEGEKVSLDGGSQLQSFSSGPLGDPSELELQLGLERLQFEDDEAGRFVPVAQIWLQRQDHQERRVELAKGQGLAEGPLVVALGAFGYSPRILLKRGDEILFDRQVPFMTRREGADQLRFLGSFQVREQGLRARGEVRLSTENPKVLGHPVLALEVFDGERSLGSGELQLGHSTELEGGVGILFAGLPKWVELVVHRRNYQQHMFVGAVLFVAGLPLWFLGWLSERRR
jgi:hypothetical protein